MATVLDLSSGEMDFFLEDAPTPQQQFTPAELPRFMPQPAPEPARSEEDTKKHQGLLILIGRYGQHRRFAKYLKEMKFTFDGLNKLSIEELEDQLTRMKVALANKGNQTSVLAYGINASIQSLELVGQLPRVKEKFDCSGMCEILSQNEEFQDIVAELELNYGCVSLLSPEKRLLWSVFQAAMVANKINGAKKARSIEPDPEPEPEPQVKQPKTVAPRRDNVMSFDD